MALSFGSAFSASWILVKSPVPSCATTMSARSPGRVTVEGGTFTRNQWTSANALGAGPGGRRGEQSDLRADPGALPRRERCSDRIEASPVPAVAEPGDRAGIHFNPRVGARPEGTAASASIDSTPSRRVAAHDVDEMPPVRASGHREVRVVEAHHQQPRGRARHCRRRGAGWRLHVQERGGGEPLGGELLQQQVRALRQGRALPGGWHQGESERTGTRRKRPPCRRRVRLPLPLQAQSPIVELVARLGRDDGMTCAHARLSERGNRFARAVAVRIGADHRPVVLPGHRLQVDDAPVRAAVLEVQEPRFARRRVDPRALVRAVDGRRALLEDDPVLVRPEDVAATRSTVCHPVFDPPAGAKM